MTRNPFTPNFGSVPVWMAGRSRLISQMEHALENGIGDPNLCTLISGARGSGKTALITYMSNVAQRDGWVTADVSTGVGMLEDIIQRIIESGGGSLHLDESKLRSVGIPAIASVSWDTKRGYEPNWRTRMNLLLDQLASEGRGLVITVDEVRHTDEMVELARVYQHFVRENKNVALFMAGLPHDVSALVADDDVSFLRRAAYHQLRNVTDAEAQVAIRRTVEFGHRTIDEDALKLMARESLGYPYLLQLMGYHMWEASGDKPNIAKQDAVDGIRLANDEFEQRILRVTYASLSAGDIKFVEAMLPDSEASTIADIAARMGVTSNYASRYRKRLEEQGIVSVRQRGVVGVDLPLFKQYVAKMAAD